MRATGPGGLILRGPIVMVDADTAAALVDLLDLEPLHRRLLGRDPVADNALAAIIGLTRTAERKCADPEEMCSADVPATGGANGSRGGSGAMVAAASADLDVSAAASELGIGERAVRGLAERRSLPGRKVASQWPFERSDVERLAERRALRRRSA